jgi:hydroxypyruvate isomerase
MPKFAANLSLMFAEVDFLQRFERAAQAGFKAVEFQFPYAWPAAQIAEQAQKHKLKVLLHNLPPGNFDAGERGLACIPGREQEFQAGVGKAIEYAKALECPMLNALAGIRPAGATEDKLRETCIANLRFAAAAMAKEHIQLLSEPINNRVDMKGFYLAHTLDALKIFDEVKHPNVWLQYDIYHMQIMEGDVTRAIRTHLPRIAHIQFADNPGRNEPGTGELNFPNLFRFIDECGYTGWLGAEYKPAAKTEDGLGWMKPYVK